MKRILAAVALVAGMGLAVLSPLPAMAASPQQQACEGAGGNWTGSTCSNPESQGGSLTGLIGDIINALLFLIGIVAVIMIIIGGFRYITAQGDTGQLATAKNTILYSIIGLVVAIAAFAIVNFVLGRF